MTFPITAALTVLCLLITLFCGWRGAQAARPHVEPRLIPWRFLMLLAFTLMVAMLVHLVALLRAPTGGAP